MVVNVVNETQTQTQTQTQTRNVLLLHIQQDEKGEGRRGNSLSYVRKRCNNDRGERKGKG
jgi:hypothetical protein